MFYVLAAVAVVALIVAYNIFLKTPPEIDEPEPDYLNMTNQEKKERRREWRERRKDSRRNWRVERINAVKEKIYAVASKRKWLFFIIAGAIIAYLVIFKGIGGGTTDGLLEKIKGLF